MVKIILDFTPKKGILPIFSNPENLIEKEKRFLFFNLTN
jgi:hypothetical protein